MQLIEEKNKNDGKDDNGIFPFTGGSELGFGILCAIIVIGICIVYKFRK